MEALLRWAEPWATLYSDSSLLQTVVLFAHLAGMLVGGGLALSADRATLRVRQGMAPGTHHDGPAADALPVEAAGPGNHVAPEPVRQLSELDALHRPVLVALTVTLASGLLMLAADLETYLVSAVFWIKMGMVVLLLANGAVLRSYARSLIQEPGGTWGRLRGAAVVSSVLWVTLVLAGVMLTSTS